MIDRISKLRNNMNEQQIDSIFVFEPNNRRYLSGFTGSTGYILITQEKKYFLTDFRYIEQAKEQTKFEVIEVKDSLTDILQSLIKENNINNIGVEEEFITYFLHKKLSEKLNLNFIKVDEMIRDLRIIKDDYEINNIKKAVQIAEKSFTEIIELIKPGISEREISLQLEYNFKKNGAESVAFDAIVASGKNSSLPHAGVTDKKIEYGDFVVIDFGCKVNGYCSDMTRTLVVGDISNDKKKIYNIVLEAQKKALEHFENTNLASEIDKISRNYISEHGYGEKFGHSLGHGVGLNIHEAPNLSPKSQTVLKSGMVVTVEPGIYIENFGGVRIEDMVIVKDSGIDNLMTFSKELIRL